MAQPGFDAAAAFAKLVMEQDADASAMNQRGIASPAFTRGRLMPEEHSIHRFLMTGVQKEMGLSKTEAIA